MGANSDTEDEEEDVEVIFEPDRLVEQHMDKFMSNIEGDVGRQEHQVIPSMMCRTIHSEQNQQICLGQKFGGMQGGANSIRCELQHPEDIWCPQEQVLSQEKYQRFLM